MKVGDRLYCYKDLINSDVEGKRHIFVVGEYYELNFINDKEVRVVYCYDDYWDYFWFYLDYSDTILNKLGDYFYTEKELRKLKLEKLNKNKNYDR